MKLPKFQLEEITAGLLPLLVPAVEQGTELMPISGAQLISNGVTRDIKNKLIVGNKKYLYPVEGMVEVDHTFKIAQLIDEAKDLGEMSEMLGEYLAKHTKSKQAVINFKPNNK